MAILAPVPFAESLTGGFVYDDHLLIEEPTSIHSLGGIAELWRGEFWRVLSTIHFHYFRPLVSTSYAVDWTLFGGHPLGFHLTNLCLHAAVAVLLYVTLARWTGAPLGAGLATLAWAWHPSKVEAVSWIAGRTDLLCALGILIACTGVKRRLEGARGKGYALELLGLFIALTSKEHGIVAPAFAAAEAWAHGWLPGSSKLEGSPERPGGATTARGPVKERARDAVVRCLVVAAPQTAIVVAYLAYRFLKYPIVPVGTGTLSFVDARLYTLETLGEFARVVFFPFQLTIQRAPIRVDATHHVIHEAARIAAGLVFVAMTMGAAMLWKKRGATWRIAGVMLGFAALAPVANVTAAKMVFLFAERFAYLPLMGFAWSLVPTRWLGWRTLVPWSTLLALWAALSARHTRDFLDDRRLWEHELAENPEQPLALRFACQEAMNRHRFREALDLAKRGYAASAGWPVPQPDRVEFALRTARSLEAITLDADRATLVQIARFFDAFITDTGTARLDVSETHVAIDTTSAEARNFRRRDARRLAQIELWAAVAASRLERCDGLVPHAEAFAARLPTPSDRVTLALALGRCHREADALSILQALGSNDPPLVELASNLNWIKGLADEDRTLLPAALRWSRARTMLFDRGGAFRALAPFRDTIVADQQGLLFFARTAWAAGEDGAARSALASRLDPGQIDALLATWSRELDRAP